LRFCCVARYSYVEPTRRVSIFRAGSSIAPDLNGGNTRESERYASKLLGDLHPCPKQDLSDPGLSCSHASSRSLSVVEIGRPSRHPSSPPKEDSACRTP